MNPYVRERINRKLDTLSDERLYQVLDYVEFLESRYAEKAAPPTSVLQRFADGVEDTLRAGGIAAGTVAEAMGFLNKAVGVLNEVAQTTATVAGDVAGTVAAAARQASAGTQPPSGTTTPASPPTPTPAAPSAESPNPPHVPDASGTP